MNSSKEQRPPIRWGILGPGSIAHKFAVGLKAIPEGELVAVGSRNPQRADAFADQYGAPNRHASYEALSTDPDIDAVYVATPHPFHKDHAIRCLEAGKAVLCEKPFTINAAEAESVVASARDNCVFLMEAMWTRYLPIMVQVRQWLDAGAIGEPLMVNADFGFRASVNPTGRLFNPALGGGALLDIGIYVVSFAAMVLGSQPAQIAAAAHLGETGVDEQTGIVLRYSSGAIANLSCAIRASTSHEARIVGSKGTIAIDPSWWRGESATLKAGGRKEHIELPLEGNGYNYEAQEVARCLAAGECESAVMSLDETVALMRILDEIRAQIGLKYPME